MSIYLAKEILSIYSKDQKTLNANYTDCEGCLRKCRNCRTLDRGKRGGTYEGSIVIRRHGNENF